MPRPIKPKRFWFNCPKCHRKTLTSSTAPLSVDLPAEVVAIVEAIEALRPDWRAEALAVLREWKTRKTVNDAARMLNYSDEQRDALMDAALAALTAPDTSKGVDDAK
jgi:hypothetical protein